MMLPLFYLTDCVPLCGGHIHVLDLDLRHNIYIVGRILLDAALAIFRDLERCLVGNCALLIAVCLIFGNVDNIAVSALYL